MSHPPPVPLEYAPRPAKGRSLAWGCHILLGFIVVASAVCFLAFLLVIVPHFVAIFKDFKTQLPPITRFVITTSSIAGPREGWLLVPLLGLAILVGGLIIDARSIEPHPMRRYTKTMIILLLLADAAWLVVFALTMFLPMSTLMDSLSGGQK
jgi:hypothetical protein